MKTKIPDAVLAAEVSRRGLVKTTAIGGLAMASSAFTLPFTRTHEILQDDKKCEMIVVIDCHMTSSAKYADILLPDCTASEQMDFALDASCGNMSYVIFTDQAIKPRFECKTIYEMTSELAKRLGVEQQFTEGRTQEEWMRLISECWLIKQLPA